MQKSSGFTNSGAVLRDHFLNGVWRSYPPLHFAVVPVNQILQRTSEDRFIGGRFYWLDEKREGFAIQLSGKEARFSNPGEVEFSQLDQDSVWRRVDNFALSDVLVNGDLVVGEFSEERPESTSIRIEKIALVAPVLESARPPTFSVKTSMSWHHFLDSVRQYFTQNHFVEINSPTLVTMPSFETHIESFSLVGHPYHLPTSPEIHLKKLLVHGWDKIFEIRPCFRKDLPGRVHQPEFFMLEWYRGFSNLGAILEDLTALLLFLGTKMGNHLYLEAGKLEEITVAEAFDRFLGFRLSPSTTERELRDLAKQRGIFIQESDLWEDLFFRLFMETIEPYLGKESPTIVRSYPKQLSALARINSAGWAERAELYWKGIEIANGFDELNDPKEHDRRLAAIQNDRAVFGRPSLPVDSDFFSAIRYGLPPSGGMALGLDRLFMVFNGFETIGSTRAYPF